MAAALAKFAGRVLCGRAGFVHGFHHRARASARGRSAKKNAGDQALGRSRGGFSTKIHAATIDENCAVALHLTAGQGHDGRQFEALYERLEAENVLEAVILDRGYDADRIRQRLAYEGLRAVIPPLPTRCGRLPFDPQHYRERNRIERFFNKLKQFRRMATRYDKLAKTFFAALHLVAAFLVAKNS